MQAPTPRALSTPHNPDALARERAEKASREEVARAHLPSLVSCTEFEPADVALITMPGSPVVLAPPAPERREKFRAHIAALVAETRVPGETYEDESHAPPPAVLAEGCGVCKGLCCRHAGDEAHIDDAALRRARALWPELSEVELVALYLEAVPEQSVEHSCIVHGEEGCTLPRELRSQTCNEFYCVPIREWQEGEAVRSSERPTALVVVEGDRVLRSALLRGSGCEPR